jgi:hypothetical protein
MGFLRIAIWMSARKHLAGCAECYKVKDRLAKVDAN